jgi:hypothetical protein
MSSVHPLHRSDGVFAPWGAQMPSPFPPTDSELLVPEPLTSEGPSFSDLKCSKSSNIEATLNAPVDHMPQTEVIAHGDGWTLFENLYMYNGTLLIISDEDPLAFPLANMTTSTGVLFR